METSPNACFAIAFLHDFRHIFCICSWGKESLAQLDKKRLKQTVQGRRVPEHLLGDVRKGLCGSTNMFQGSVLAPGTDESPSIWLYCRRAADRLMSSAWKERQKWGRVCRSSLRPVLGSTFQSCSPTNSASESAAVSTAA